MKKYIVAIGYGENVQQVTEFFTVDEKIEAETAEAAAIEVFNGLEPEEEKDAIFQVREEDDNRYEYFTF